MVSNENNEEMSVNDILSSIKEVISSEQDLKKSANDDNFIELTDVVDEEAILLDDVVDLNNDRPSNDLSQNDEQKNNLKFDNSNFISDLSIDDIIRETIKETLNEWFAKNLKTIVEESVKEEVAKLLKNVIKMIEKKYDPSEAERRIYDMWESKGLFKPTDTDSENFSIVMPPPNVTGSLHMGHALNTTLQDIIVRYQRMKGKNVLWQPGTDHAGIATQMVVERNLLSEKNISRRELGRESFVNEIWRWKEKSGGTITEQLRRLGASCDWSRERFTMDDGLSDAVIKVFVELYNDGLIYKDKRLVNWDPKLKTAISDLEVDQRETKGVYGISNTLFKIIVINL